VSFHNKVVRADLNEDVIEGGQEWTDASVSMGIGTRRVLTLKAEVK